MMNLAAFEAFIFLFIISAFVIARIASGVAWYFNRKKEKNLNFIFYTHLASTGGTIIFWYVLVTSVRLEIMPFTEFVLGSGLIAGTNMGWWLIDSFIFLIVKERNIKLLSLLSGIVVIAVIVGFGIHSFTKRYYVEPPISVASKAVFMSGKKPAEITKHVRIAGMDYDVPLVYFNASVPYATEDHTLYLVFMYPDFNPISGSQRSVWEAGQEHRMFSLLAKDERFLKDFDSYVWDSIRDTGYAVKSGEKYGLQTYALAPDKKHWDRDEPYVLLENGKVATFIRCSQDKRAGKEGRRNLLCHHQFSENGLRYRVFYNKSYLPQWSRIELGTSALLARFHRGALKKHLDKINIPQDRIDEKVKNMQIKGD